MWSCWLHYEIAMIEAWALSLLLAICTTATAAGRAVALTYT